MEGFGFEAGRPKSQQHTDPTDPDPEHWLDKSLAGTINGIRRVKTYSRLSTIYSGKGPDLIQPPPPPPPYT